MIALFTSAMFAGAFLLFWCQPMLGKMLLPYLGGTPAVWITSMFFFQVLLLAGYFYAHQLSTRLRLKTQVILHLMLMLLAFLFLPLTVSPALVKSLPFGANPVLWLLKALLFTVGIPFFFISATSPLLQRWFSRSGHAAAADPYFLYAASNLGSLLALVTYPLLLEPLLRLHRQSLLWAVAYGLLLAFFLGIGLLLFVWSARPRSKVEPATGPGSTLPAEEIAPVPWNRRLRWIFLAFVPSSLMLGVTSYLTNDIASFPLLWVVPLVIYLLTFILVFARRRFIPQRLVLRILPGVTILLAFALLAEILTPVWFLFLVSLLFLFFAAIACHGELAADRPGARFLTQYYLYLSIGGALGGFFNSLLAPMLFRGIGELPVVMMAMFLGFFHLQKGEEGKMVMDILAALGTGALTALMAVFIPRILRFTIEPYQLWMFVIFGLPLVLAYTFLHRPLRFSLALVGIFAGSLFFHAVGGRLLISERNFFGTMRVSLFAKGPTLRLFHGTTLHGMQYLAPEKRGDPLAYYHRLGPFGQVMQEFNARPGFRSVGVIGVGVGSMLAYATPQQAWTYYEIDPDIVRLAQDENYFTFFRDTKAARVDVVLGDARLKMAGAAPGKFDLVVLDAFSSDVVPTHLLTREAFTLYLSKLASGGMICGHISSLNLNLAPVVATAAGSLNLYCLQQKDDRIMLNGRTIEGKFPSSWVVMARGEKDLGTLVSDPRWKTPGVLPRRRVWTDDYSNILSVLNWF